MNYIRRKSGEVELDLHDNLVLGLGDTIIYETNDPKEFYGSWTNPENQDSDEPEELGTFQNKVEKDLNKDKKAVGWHEPYIKQGKSGRRCLYCKKLLPANARSDKKFCDKQCRQNYRYHNKVKKMKPGKDMPEKVEGGEMQTGMKLI